MKSLPLKLMLAIGVPTVALSLWGAVFFSKTAQSPLSDDSLRGLFLFAFGLVLATFVSVHFLVNPGSGASRT